MVSYPCEDSLDNPVFTVCPRPVTVAQLNSPAVNAWDKPKLTIYQPIQSANFGNGAQAFPEEASPLFVPYLNSILIYVPDETHHVPKMRVDKTEMRRFYNK